MASSRELIRLLATTERELRHTPPEELAECRALLQMLRSTVDSALRGDDQRPSPRGRVQAASYSSLLYAAQSAALPEEE